MPNVSRYKHAKIYRLVNDINDHEYIGSTCNKLTIRLAAHKRAAETHPNKPINQYLNSIGWDNVHIILIEECPVPNIEHLNKLHHEWVSKRKPVLNNPGFYRGLLE